MTAQELSLAMTTKLLLSKNRPRSVGGSFVGTYQFSMRGINLVKYLVRDLSAREEVH